MEDPVDFIETFPANYDGSPNVTMDQAGREVTPRHFAQNPGFYPQEDMVAPPNRGFIPPTMPPMYSGVAHTTPVYQPRGAPKAAAAYDPFVRPNPLEFAAAQGQVVVKESPSPALHDLPSPDLTSANHVVKRQPQQKFFPAQAKTEENNGFMNDPVPFASGLGNLQTGSSSRPERSETKSQVQEDFESSFQPGFTQFGNFGPQLGHFGPAQTNGRTVWGAPAET